MRAGSLMLTLALLSCPALCWAGNKKPSNDASAPLFGLDKVWSMHLTIQPDQWEKMQPKRGLRGFGFPPNGDAKPGEVKSDGKPAEVKRDAKPAESDRDAKPRGGFGFDFSYVKGGLETDGHKLKDVGVRYKGNGSYAMAMGRLKRPFKIDLDRYHSGQMFYGQKKLTLNSNSMDASAAREVLSYGVYRRLGVPASRTAYVRLTLTVPGKYDKEFVGLYTLVETIDKTFLKDRFGSAKGLLLKPERVGPLEHQGDERGGEGSLRQAGQGQQGRVETGCTGGGYQQDPTAASWVWRPRRPAAGRTSARQSWQRARGKAGWTTAPWSRGKAGRDRGGQPPGGPPPAGPGGRPGFGPPGGGLGGMFARSLVEKAGKDGKVNEDRLLAAASKLFAEADKNKDGKLDDKELIEALNKLMPPFGPPGGGRPGQGGAPPAAAPGAPAAGQKEPKKERK